MAFRDAMTYAELKDSICRFLIYLFVERNSGGKITVFEDAEWSLCIEHHLHVFAAGLYLLFLGKNGTADGVI